MLGGLRDMTAWATKTKLADVVIRIMDLAQARGWNVAGALVEKAEFNKSRARRHGKEF